jgi:hypothetical protein
MQDASTLFVSVNQQDPAAHNSGIMRFPCIARGYNVIIIASLPQADLSALTGIGEEVMAMLQEVKGTTGSQVMVITFLRAVITTGSMEETLLTTIIITTTGDLNGVMTNREIAIKG